MAPTSIHQLAVLKAANDNDRFGHAADPTLQQIADRFHALKALRFTMVFSRNFNAENLNDILQKLAIIIRKQKTITKIFKKENTEKS
jgi:hypothetical protein